MKKTKRRIRPRAVICLVALLFFVIAAAWLLVNKFTEHNEIPIITLKTEEITLDVNTVFDVEQYIESVKDEAGNPLVFSKTKHLQGTYWLSEEVNTSKAGSYEITIYALDSNNNQAEKKLTVIIKKKTSDNASANANKNNNTSNNSTSKNENKAPVDNSTYDDSLDPNNCEPYYVKGILLVNKRHPLPPDFGALDQTSAQALEKMQKAASEVGYSIPTISGFRTYDYQVTLYNNYVAQDGQEAADTYSARPGFSEHQSGMVFDVGEIDNDYGKTAAGTWLREHCHEFGFIIRYPQGKEKITGYMYEPWHIRYVGIEVATQIYRQGITLEEYLGEY